MMERVLSWALGLTLAVLLLVVAFLQMSGPTPNPIFGMIAARSHIGLFEPYGRYLAALAEIVALGLVIWPRTRPQGAILALVIALVAVILHLSPWLGVQLPQGPAVSQALAMGRSPAQIAALHLPTDKGALFLLSLAIGVLSAGVYFVERAKVRALSAKKAKKAKKPVGAFA
jgi:hypothetical protein